MEHTHEKHDKLTEDYLRVFVETITHSSHNSELDLLLQLLADKNIQVTKTNPRKVALMNHLQNELPHDGYKQATEIYSWDDAVFVVEDKNGAQRYFKVYTEKECIDELTEWYESDFESYNFFVDEIAYILSMPKAAVLALDLLSNFEGNSEDGVTGYGTEKLLALLNTMDKLKDLVAFAKGNNFMALAKDDYAYKSGDYYILEDYDYHRECAANV